MKIPRRFNIDLQPKFVYSTGDVVDWTVNCGVSLYLEFKPLEAGLLLEKNGIRRVPCNKSEIFADTSLTVLEKRLLMKFIEYCTKSVETGDYEVEKSFREVMDEKKLPINLQNILLYAILLLNTVDITLGQALSRMESYVSSLGIYKDNCALLYPMYGSSDIPQGFCRMCAVYEGTYVITEELKIENIACEGTVNVINSSFGQLKARNLYINPVYAYLDPGLAVSEVSQVFRAVALCRGPVRRSENPVLLSVPPKEFNNEKVVYILELNDSTSTVPSGYSMLHIWTEVGSLDLITSIIYSLPTEILFLASYSHHVVQCSGNFQHVYNPGGIEILNHFVTIT
jgi:Rab proteins geranylgeranyltransferase component A